MTETADRFSGFRDIVTSLAEISEIMGKPGQRTLDKVADRIDEVGRDFIAKSPFLVIASSNAEGFLDLSPKGDPAGFVEVIDERHLAIPDRLGNRRVDTFHNLLEDPQIGLIFFIPGRNETLRVAGEARIVRDDTLRERMAVGGHLPDFALVVYVTRAFFHCPKCVIRSHLWQPEHWPADDGTRHLAEMLVALGGPGDTADTMQDLIDTDTRERLY
jgi:PPOX class probable FMN-dependent enzyme